MSFHELGVWAVRAFGAGLGWTLGCALMNALLSLGRKER